MHSNAVNIFSQITFSCRKAQQALVLARPMSLFDRSSTYVAQASQHKHEPVELERLVLVCYATSTPWYIMTDPLGKEQTDAGLPSNALQMVSLRHTSNSSEKTNQHASQAPPNLAPHVHSNNPNACIV